MALNKISYPHPVLGNGDDISGWLMMPKIEYIITDEAIQLHASNLSTGHPDIDSLVHTKYAQWQIRIKCARTFIRENYLTTNSDWTKNLVAPDFEGTVEIETQVIAVHDIDNYSPIGAHEDYGDEKFNIKSGEILAIGPFFSFHVDKTYDPLKAPVASLLQIEEGAHKIGPFKVTLDDDLIIVKLSKVDWLEYAGIRDRVPAVLHSAIVMPVLAKAITEIENNQGTLWEGRLKDIISQKGIDIEDPITAAQELLDSPLKRTFLEVNASLDKGVY